MERDWLWDRNIPEKQAIKILREPRHAKFIPLASLLLSRKNTPREILRHYIKPEEFCRWWPMIKRRMRKDAWNNPRIEFWQAVYEKLLEKFRAKGVTVSYRKRAGMASGLCVETGQKLKALRKQRKLTQKMLSRKLKISQQMISRIESGKENSSLLTLDKIAKELGVKVSVNIA